MTRSIIVIPARYASTRLDKKMLLDRTGKPLIQHTYEAASRSQRCRQVIVATDHEDIASAVTAFGGEAVMTDPSARSGTDRIAEVVAQIADVDLVVNVQGDEPELDPAAIDLAVELLDEDDAAVMSTLATPIRDRATLEEPSAVKVVFDHQHNALYFSRSVIPHPRNDSDELLEETPAVFHLHLGLYVYRRDFLLSIPQLSPSRHEQVESLEQLRVLDNGFRIKVGVIPSAPGGIDTPADYEAFVRRQSA